MNANRLIFQFHKWSGLLIAGVIVVVGITGSLLVYLDEIKLLSGQTKVINSQIHRLPLDALLAAVHRQQPGSQVTGFEAAVSSTMAWRVNLDRQGQRLTAEVNPYTGQVLTVYASDTSLTGWIYNLHTSLAVPPWGDLVVALTALLFTVSSLTGLWLQRKFLGRVFRVGIRRDKGTKTAYSDTHKLAGSLSLLTNLVLGGTGIYISLYAYDPEFLAKGPDTHRNVLSQKSPISLDKLLADAQNRIPDFSLYYLSLPPTADAPITLSGRIPYGNAVYTPAYSSADAQYSAFDGHLVALHDLRRAGFWEQASYFGHEFHYGKYAGWPVKLLYFIGGLLPALLAVTGLVVWWKKRRRSLVRTTYIQSYNQLN